MAPHGGGHARIIVFDGVCVLCSAWVRFVLARDREELWRFVAIQSPAGRALARRHGIDPDNPPTAIALAGGHAYMRSDLTLAVLATVPGWRWARHARLIPRPWRDWAYDRVALNRYRLFGRRDTCLLPTPDIRARFIESAEDLPQ